MVSMKFSRLPFLLLGILLNLCQGAWGVAMEKEYPAIGFGTYRLKQDACFHAVRQAAELGYRVIDTATFYGNFEPIGRALKTFGRQNFYLISKVWPDSQTPEGLKKDLAATLKQLQTDYLDLYLLHWPNSSIPIEATLQTMEELRKQGKIRHIGLSNVTVNHLKRALEVGVPISWVQVEMHPHFYDAELVQFCHAHSIGVQAWAPLGRGHLSEDALLKEIGERYSKTASQVALKWSVQHGCLPLPMSRNREHIAQNMASLDFNLSETDMQRIDENARKGERFRLTATSGLGFTDEFDYTYEQCWPVK